MFDTDAYNGIEIIENEPLSRHSTFKIGGNARYAFFPKDRDELVLSVNECRRKELDYKIVGNASNILFDDRGYNGGMIFTSNMTSMEYIRRADHTLIRVDCGMSLTKLSLEAGKKQSLSGLEFAYGIPGTVGGAVYMNAGAYSGQMSNIVIETEYLDLSDMQIRTLDAVDHKYAYRHSIFMDHPEYVILSTTLKLSHGDPKRIFATMDTNMSARKEKQPLEYPNAGSVFKRPAENIYVGKLIQDADLKGYTVGGAQISEKHAGFIINKGGATSADVLSLIEHIKKVIADKYDISLECEIIYTPYIEKEI